MIINKKRKKILFCIILSGLLCFISLHFLTYLALKPARSNIKTIEKFNYKKIEFYSRPNVLIKGWMINASHERGVVILLHGIRANRLSMLKRAAFLVKNHYTAVLIDFQAHGESAGEIITLGFKESEDVKAAVKYIKKRKKNVKIAIIGTSLGGAAALLADISAEINLLVVEGVFSTIEEAIYNRISKRIAKPFAILTPLVSFFLKYKLNIPDTGIRPMDYMSKLKCPVFVISGKADRYTLEQETIQMYKKAPEPKKLWLVPGAGHVDLYAYSKAKYRKNILWFLNRYMK